MDVSIIIVNWNTRESLRDCLRSIFEQAGNLVYEVIVVDNASTDGSVEMVENDFREVKLIKNQENRGFAAANNQGIALAEGRYILLLNSDTIICDNAIEKTMRYADKRSDAAVIGCQVWENSDTIQMTCFGFPGLVNIILNTFGLSRQFKLNRFFGRERMLWWRRDSERQVDVVSGMFMFVRREAIEQVGMMDEDYFLYYEETDWCRRFAGAGWKLVFWPGARIIHTDVGSKSSNQIPLKMFVQKQKSQLIFLKKHSGRLSYWLGSLLISVSFILRLSISLLIAALKKIMCKRIDNELTAIRRQWAAFKFCAFGVEP
jgi:GT2 family glycosyltransferase